MKILLIVINFVFLSFCLTNSYCDEIKLNDIIPRTSLTVLIETGHAWSITQINDGTTEDLSPYNGFVSSHTEGSITLELVDEYDLTTFLLWNDVNVSKEGVRQFRLEFYDKSDTIISESQIYTANSQINANEFVFDNIVKGVKKVNLIILTASHQIEIRELEFIGEKHCSCIVDSDDDGIIDQWDKCPNTENNSVVLSNGCSANLGDINANGKLDIGDSIKILKVLTTDLSTKYYKSCKEILEHDNSAIDGTYIIDPDGIDNNPPFEVYCDMTLSGGGWSLIAKAKGSEVTKLNGDDINSWINKEYFGDISNLIEETALGQSYHTISFNDIMIRSINDTSKYIAWRHPQLILNLYSAVKSGSPIIDGLLINGNIHNLYYHSSCSTGAIPEDIYFGILVTDGQNDLELTSLDLFKSKGWLSAIIGWGSSSTGYKDGNNVCGGLGIKTINGDLWALSRHIHGFGNGCTLAEWKNGKYDKGNQIFESHALFVR